MKSTFVSVLVLVALLLISCSKDDKQITSSSTGLNISALAGVWDVEIWEYSLASDTTQKIDWVITRGLSATLTISDNGDFTFNWIIGIDTLLQVGTLTMRGNTIYVNADDNDPARFELNIPILTLFATEAELVDFDLDGIPEDVWLKTVYRRR